MAKWAVASIIRMGQLHRSSRQSAFVSLQSLSLIHILLLQPDLHIIPGDVQAILSTQTEVLEGLTAHKDVPVLQHLSLIHI